MAAKRGRPPEARSGPAETRITVRITTDLLSWIDKHRGERTRARFVRDVLRTSALAGGAVLTHAASGAPDPSEAASERPSKTRSGSEPPSAVIPTPASAPRTTPESALPTSKKHFHHYRKTDARPVRTIQGVPQYLLRCSCGLEKVDHRES